MLFDPSNRDLIQALAYWLRGTGVRYQFDLENDQITGLSIYNDQQELVKQYSPGEWVTVQ